MLNNILNYFGLEFDKKTLVISKIKPKTQDKIQEKQETVEEFNADIAFKTATRFREVERTKTIINYKEYLKDVCKEIDDLIINASVNGNFQIVTRVDFIEYNKEISIPYIQDFVIKRYEEKGFRVETYVSYPYKLVIEISWNKE